MWQHKGTGKQFGIPLHASWAQRASKSSNPPTPTLTHPPIAPFIHHSPQIPILSSPLGGRTFPILTPRTLYITALKTQQPSEQLRVMYPVDSPGNRLLFVRWMNICSSLNIPMNWMHSEIRVHNYL